ncbi:MAG: 3-methyladenine DNA glycosylase [Candidatus Moranbacteria bacterium RBG_13_45_13]|nr:MAG: 3-methyladenine DNA glycosylase [Candidatus Moranbacteria bacterium RBG_13_45_13]
MKILPRRFYNRHTLNVAKDLLGCFLLREYGGKKIRALITEVEAYHGEDDLACHASRGRTPRTEVMYGQPGHAYVYMIYGMYHCLNIVTEKKDFPAAVLIRAVHPQSSSVARSDRFIRGRTAGQHRERTDLAYGPGKLCKFLKIDRKLNQWDLTKGDKLWLEARNPKIKLPKIVKSRRIGIDYAQHCREYLWRFSLKE